MIDIFPGRLGLQQRVLPAYRAPFYDTLARACRGGLSVFAGQALPEESIATTDRLEQAELFPARNRNFFPIRSPFYQCWQVNILEWLEDAQPDVLIVEANARYPSTHLAVSWMHSRGRPVLGCGLGEPPAAGWLAGLRRRSRLRLVRSLDGVIAYSRRGAEQYRALGFSAEQVFVAPNAATPRPATPPPDRPPFFDGRPAVLFVGRMQARKRIDNLLQACAALPEHLRPRLWVVGDGPAREQFAELAARIYPQAEFPGALHGERLEPFFNRADLFVLPGTGGLAVQQAMAYGLPVVVAEGDGTQEDLVGEDTGWSIPPDDLPALQAALEEALSDPARLRRMGAAAYCLVRDRVNLEQMVASFVRAVSWASLTIPA